MTTLFERCLNMALIFAIVLILGYLLPVGLERECRRMDIQAASLCKTEGYAMNRLAESLGKPAPCIDEIATTIEPPGLEVKGEDK